MLASRSAILNGFAQQTSVPTAFISSTCSCRTLALMDMIGSRRRKVWNVVQVSSGEDSGDEATDPAVLVLANATGRLAPVQDR